MFDNLSNKKKFYLVAGSAIVFVWLSFEFGFSRTIELKNQLEIKKQKLSDIKDAPVRLHDIEVQLEELRKRIGDISGSGDEVSPYLIEKVSEFCKNNDLLLSEMPRKHLYRREGFTIATYRIRVEGSFHDLLRLLHEMEHNSSAGKLCSVVFESKYILRENRRKLFGIYYIQSVEKSDSDNE